MTYRHNKFYYTCPAPDCDGTLWSGTSLDEYSRDCIHCGQRMQLTIRRATMKGKKIAITGTLPYLTRVEASKIIAKKGGQLVSAVSEDTDYLLAGENPGSKYAKAEKLGVEIISEEGFLRWAGHWHLRENQQVNHHDPHYRKIESALGIESTAKLGEVLFELRADTMPDYARLNLDKALKYIIRAGCKDGQSWVKDVDKAINFLTRAKTGRWAK